MSPPAKPPPRPFRPNSKSHDDLESVAALDAAEARLRAAKMLADDEADRADVEEEKRLALQKELDTLRATQPVVVKIPEEKPSGSPGKPISLSPQAVTLR